MGFISLRAGQQKAFGREITDQLLTDGELEARVHELNERLIKGGGINEEEIERQDVVNSAGDAVGDLPRKVIWDNGLQGYTKVVNIFIKNRRGEILVPVRSKDKKYLPGGYDFSCGENLKSGESYDEAARRGLQEELGLEGVDLGKGILLSPYKDGGVFCFVTAYLVSIDEDRKLVFNKQEIERLEWMSVNQINELMQKETELFKADYPAIFRRFFSDR